MSCCGQTIKWMKTISTIGRDWLKVKLFTPEFNLTTHDSYVTILVEVFTNHILAESTYFTNHTEQGEHSIMVLKLSNKYQIIWQCHNFRNILVNDYKFCKHFLPSRK